MAIACLLGSPRPGGNSDFLARQVCEAAQARGAEIWTFRLNALEFRGCQACRACKKESAGCVLTDDLREPLDAMRRADGLVLASPVYYGDVSAQLKAFIDRTYGFLKPDYLTQEHPANLPRGRRCVMVLAQGNPDPTAFADIFPRYEYFLNWYGYDCRLVRAVGCQGKDDARGMASAIGAARSCGEWLAG